MAMKNEVGRDFLESLCHRHLEKSTLMKTALARIKFIAKTQESRKVESMCLRYPGRSAEGSTQRPRSRVKDQATPVVSVKGKGDGTHGDCRQWTSNRSSSRVAKDSFKHDDQKKEQEQVISDSEHPVRNLNDSLLRNLRPAIAHGRAVQESTFDLLVSINQKGSCQSGEFCHSHPLCCVSHTWRGANAHRATHVRVLPVLTVTC